MNVLAFFAHPDDETMLCGGTLAILARHGAAVHYLCATRGEGDHRPWYDRQRPDLFADAPTTQAGAKEKAVNWVSPLCAHANWLPRFAVMSWPVR